MYFNKPLNQLTFEDVIDFLNKEVPENTLLDYKLMLPQDNEKFAKTIAAFANSMGGTVVIGVKDEHDKPKPPFAGIPFHSKIRGQIESIIQNYIDPVVFVDIATCKDPRGNNMFVVVNIPQSNLTPHLVGRLKRAYVRTGQSSRPEIIVHPDKLPWLMDNRRKSQNLRHILSDKAQAHFSNFLRASFKQPENAQAVASFTLVPLYPQTPVTDYKKLPALLDNIRIKTSAGNYFPPKGGLTTVQDGVIIPVGPLATMEFNCYGLCAYQSVLANAEKYLNPQRFYEELVLFFKTAANFYKEIGFISPLYLRLKLSNARGTKIKTETGDKPVIEDYIRIDKNIQPLDIENGDNSFLAELLEEFAWSIDLPFKDKEEAQKLISKVI